MFFLVLAMAQLWETLACLVWVTNETTEQYEKAYLLHYAM